MPRLAQRLMRKLVKMTDENVAYARASDAALRQRLLQMFDKETGDANVLPGMKLHLFTATMHNSSKSLKLRLVSTTLWILKPSQRFAEI